MARAQQQRRYPTKATTFNIPVLTYLAPEQKAALDEVAHATRLPKTILLREAVDMVLAKYKRKGAAK